MRKWIGIIVLLSFSNQFEGQQLTHYSFFTYNYMQYNPAVVGTAPCLDLKFGIRRQWQGFKGAPSTAFTNMHGKLVKEKKFKFTGIGATMETDKSGPFSYTSLNIAVSEHIKLASKYYLAAGLGIGFTQYSVQYGEMTFEYQDIETAITGGINAFIFPTINAGLWLYRSDKFYGLSVRNLNAPKVEGTVDTRLNRHWTFANGYAARVTEELSFKPAFLINYVGKSKPSLDAQFLLDYKEMISVGLAGRSGHGFSALLKLSVVKYVTVAYAYDVTMNKIKYAGANTHELIIGIRACTKLNPLHVPCAAYD